MHKRVVVINAASTNTETITMIIIRTGEFTTGMGAVHTYMMLSQLFVSKLHKLIKPSHTKPSVMQKIG